MKPIAYYRSFNRDPYVGEVAMLFGVTGHHNKNLAGDWVITSEVVRVEKDGEIETLNTIYRPMLPHGK